MVDQTPTPAGGAAGAQTTLTLPIAVIVSAILVLIASFLVSSFYDQRKNYSDAVGKALKDQIVDHAAVLSYSRAWDIAVMKTSGMCFGFLLTFLGALYVLRTRDNEYDLTLSGLGKEGTLKTSSPGLVMITLGVALVVTSILKESTVQYTAPTRMVVPGGGAAQPEVPAEPEPKG